MINILITIDPMNTRTDMYEQNVARLNRIGRFAEVARRLSAQVGKKINPSWVSHVASGYIDDAGYKRFSALIVVLDELEPRADSVGQGADAAQPEVFYGVDKGMSPVYQQVTLDKPRVCRRWVGRDQEKMQVGL